MARSSNALPYAADDVIEATRLTKAGIGSHEVARPVRDGILWRLCTGW